MSPRRAVVAVSVGALALALAACDQGGAEPTTAPSSVTPSTTAAPTSAPPTEEPTSAAPEVPAPNPADFPGMDQQTEEGAKQAFRYFWAALLYGYATGDVAPFRSISADECKYCVDAQSDVERLKERGEYWDLVVPAETYARTTSESSETVYVTFDFVIPAHREPGETPGAPTDHEDSAHSSIGKLNWVNGAWKVQGVDLDR